ncbi:MAG: metal ABC transporter ATP-binding protein [Actinomycetes bacterium]
MGAAEGARVSTPAFAVEGAEVVLGRRPVLRGVDLVVGPGELVALLGANGSGKSTLVRAIVGLVPLSAGTVHLFGVPLARFAERHRLGYVPQRVTATSGVPATVAEVVSAGRLPRRGLLRPTRAADRAAVQHALTLVDLADRGGQPVGSLSGGQQQRVLVARALAAEPDLLLLDEPMAGVDQPSQQAFADTLRHLSAAGTSVLLVAHELGPLEPLVSRAVVLRDGRVVHDGAPPPASGHHAHPGHDHVHPHAEGADQGWLS